MSSKKTPSLVFSLINKSFQECHPSFIFYSISEKNSLMQEFDPSSGFLVHQY